jgi:hypothetical protein
MPSAATWLRTRSALATTASMRTAVVTTIHLPGAHERRPAKAGIYAKGGGTVRVSS